MKQLDCFSPRFTLMAIESILSNNSTDSITTVFSQAIR